ncbi:MAG: exo-beta-N-acetylmuramidase NamZ family protein [Flavobacteriaceae bacterium]
MFKKLLKIAFLFVVIPLQAQNEFKVGAAQLNAYLPLLKNKSVAIVANQTSVIDSHDQTAVHLVDSLLQHKVHIAKVFAPEHGFRGIVDAGEHVDNEIDQKTGLPLISLYGKNKKPTMTQLEGVDLVLFDIQDVGVRFYTYIATLQLVMEACIEKDIPIVVLDRPNPHMNYVDGPTMQEKHQSFLGMNSIPLVYGMSIGEYAKMINEEGWVDADDKAELHVIQVQDFNRTDKVSLAIKPSPNLPNDQAIALYPSLGFFEGTTINAGRGTDAQFQRYGSPEFKGHANFELTYTPVSKEGAKYPKHQNKICYGEDLSQIVAPQSVNLDWLIKAYKYSNSKTFFLDNSFTKHAGTEKLRIQIEQGKTANEIQESWSEDLEEFNEIRLKYLIYN